MSAKTVLTADQMLERIESIRAYSEEHPEAWRNEVASHLNALLARAEYVCNVAYDESDQAYCAAALAICERVAEVEGLKTVERQPS